MCTWYAGLRRQKQPQIPRCARDDNRWRGCLGAGVDAHHPTTESSAGRCSASNGGLEFAVWYSLGAQRKGTMTSNPLKPQNPDYIEEECESPTHKCGACGRPHALRDNRPVKSPCCSEVLWPIDGCQRWAITWPIDPNDFAGSRVPPPNPSEGVGGFHLSVSFIEGRVE
jgi:hypothetical protein